MHARKSLLFDEGSTWIKKVPEDNFDVSMGSYDGAEICELVGLYLLNQLSREHEKSNLEEIKFQTPNAISSETKIEKGTLSGLTLHSAWS